MADNSAFEKELAEYLNNIQPKEPDAEGKTPAERNPLYLLMVYTYIHKRNVRHINLKKEDLIWNRFFYGGLDDTEKREIGLFSDKEKNIVYNFEPLTEQERQSLKKFSGYTTDSFNKDTMNHDFQNLFWTDSEFTYYLNDLIFYNAWFGKSRFEVGIHFYNCIFLGQDALFNNIICWNQIKFENCDFKNKFFNMDRSKFNGDFLFNNNTLKGDVINFEYSYFSGNEVEFINNLFEARMLLWFRNIKFHNQSISFAKTTFKKTKDDNDTIDFTKSVFQGELYFQGTKFYGNANFSNTNFKENVVFSNAKFKKSVKFDNASFDKKASYKKIECHGKANFLNIKFQQNVDFTGAKFHGDANFSQSKFFEQTNFTHAKFYGGVSFEKTYIYQHKTGDIKTTIDFKNAIFRKKANFSEIYCENDIDFSKAQFGDKDNPININFWRAEFNGKAFHDNVRFYGNNIYFKNAKYMGEVIGFVETEFYFIPDKSNQEKQDFSFENTVFSTKANFQKSQFHALPHLSGTDFRVGINLDKADFSPELSNKSENDCSIKGKLKNYQEAAISWHVLQNEMEKSGYHDQAIRYFGYELEAKRLHAKKENNYIQHTLLYMYKILSDYGRSISRPLITWIISIAVFWFLHFLFLNQAGYLLFIFLIIPIPFLLFKNSFLKISAYVIGGIFLSIIFSYNIPKQALQLSLKGAVPFVSDQTTFYDRIFADDNQIENESELTAKITDNITKKETIITETSLSSVVKSDAISHSPLPFDNSLELYILPFLHGLQTIFSLLCLFLFGLGIRNNLRLK